MPAQRNREDKCREKPRELTPRFPLRPEDEEDQSGWTQENLEAEGRKFEARPLSPMAWCWLMKQFALRDGSSTEILSKLPKGMWTRFVESAYRHKRQLKVAQMKDVLNEYFDREDYEFVNTDPGRPMETSRSNPPKPAPRQHPTPQKPAEHHKTHRREDLDPRPEWQKKLQSVRPELPPRNPPTTQSPKLEVVRTEQPAPPAPAPVTQTSASQAPSEQLVADRPAPICAVPGCGSKHVPLNAWVIVGMGKNGKPNPNGELKVLALCYQDIKFLVDSGMEPLMGTRHAMDELAKNLNKIRQRKLAALALGRAAVTLVIKTAMEQSVAIPTEAKSS